MNLAAVGNHLWQSTIFAAVAWVLVQILRQNSARVRYSIWVLASVKFLLPLSVLIAVGSHLSLPTKPYAATVNVPAIEFIALPFGPDTVQRVLLATVATPRPTQKQFPTEGVVVVWLLGVAAVVTSGVARVRRIRKILSTAQWLDDGRGADWGIRCATTESVIEPGIHGIFRPVLLLPSGITERLETRQMNAIFDHEVCHIRRHDNLFATIHMAVEAVFWFHPLVWWMGMRLVDERERACDEQVLANGGNPKVYASAILKVCEFYVASPLECVAGVSGGNLKKRIEEIMNHCAVRKLSNGRKLLLIGAGVMALGIPLVVGMLNAPPVRAQSQFQDIRGDWQGSLKVGDRELRVVLRISAEGKTLKALLYSIDQGSQSMPSSAITQNGSTIKITFAARGANYEGKLSPDGKAITGTWNQGAPMPLNLARATPGTAWPIPEPPPPPTPMAADAAPTFEVATIKPSESRDGMVGLKVNPGLVNGRASLGLLIKIAYGLNSRQIIGGPSWVDEVYDVTGKPDKPGKPNLAQVQVMLQKLMADRFQLVFHREKRESPVYAITVIKSGAKLTRSAGDPNGSPDFRVGLGRLSFGNATMGFFASTLQNSGNIVDGPVVDQTGLGSARYDFMLSWTPDASQLGGAAPAAQNPDAPPDLFTAFQEQLGLKLESTKALVDVLVIDHVEKPSEN